MRGACGQAFSFIFFCTRALPAVQYVDDRTTMNTNTNAMKEAAEGDNVRPVSMEEGPKGFDGASSTPSKR